MKLIHGSVLAGLAALGGCAGDDKIDLGDDRIGVIGSSLTDYAGNWEGHAEAYRFSDGTDHIRISLNASGAGVIEVGDSGPLPAPDADHGYPPSAVPGPDFVDPYLLEPGFEYAIENAAVQDARIQLSTPLNQLYEEWCALLPPVYDAENDRYGCLPNLGFGSEGLACYLGNDPEQMPIDCGKLSCRERCSCDASSCSAQMIGASLSLDGELAEEGAKLVGTLVIGEARLTVRMTRAD